MNNEEKLIAKAKAGEREAFGVLYDNYVSGIYRFVLIKVGSKADAEDLTHQVFLNAWQKIGRYISKGFPFSSWLYRIAQNAVIDFYRTNKKHVDIDAIPEDALSDKPEFDRQIDNAMQVRLVHSTLKELDQDQQSVLIMRFVNELTNKEVAQALGKSEGAVRVIQHRALKQLRAKIDETTRFN